MDPYVAGYRKAAKHLLALGLTPAPCKQELQSLWASSREDRDLVAAISESWESLSD